jgi:hypothetical protein
MLKQSASINWKAQAKVEAQMKEIRSSLNLDLDLSLVHSLWTIEALLCRNNFSVPCTDTSTSHRILDRMVTVTSPRRAI